MPHRILADAAAPALQYTVWLLLTNTARTYCLVAPIVDNPAPSLTCVDHARL